MFGLMYRGGLPFQPSKDMPPLSSKTYLITGGNTGLGAETILQLAKHGRPKRIYLAARSAEKANATIATVRKACPSTPEDTIVHLPLDLSSLASVKEAAETFLSKEERLDVLMNNAGIMACPPGVTKDGFETQFGTNHMGHFYLTQLLLPALENAAKASGGDARIVTLSSDGHKAAPKTPHGLDLAAATSDMASYNTWTRYGQSKLANAYFAAEHARRHPDVMCVSIHPGGVQTELSRGPAESYPWLKPVVPYLLPLLAVKVEEGARNQIWAAVCDFKELRQGKYYIPVGKVFEKGRLGDEEGAKELWDWSVEALKQRGFA